MLPLSESQKQKPPMTSLKSVPQGRDSPFSLSGSSSSTSLSSDSGSSSVATSTSSSAHRGLYNVDGKPTSQRAEDAKDADDLGNDDDGDSSSDESSDENNVDNAGASTTATTMIDRTGSNGASPGTDDSAILSDENTETETARDDIEVNFYGIGDDVTACLGLLTSSDVAEADANFLADFLTRPPLPNVCGLGAVIQRLKHHGQPSSPFPDSASDEVGDPMPPAVEAACLIGSPESEELLQRLLRPHLVALWGCLLQVGRPSPELTIDLDDFQEIDLSAIGGVDSPDAAAAAAATVPLRRQQQSAPQRPPPPGAYRRSVAGGIRSAGGNGGVGHDADGVATAPMLFSREVTLLKAADQPLGFTAVRCICPNSAASSSGAGTQRAANATNGNDGTASSSSLSASPRPAIAVARVLAGSQADVAGGLRPGDIIREANGQPMETPEALQRLLRQSVGRVTLRIESETLPVSPMSPPPPPTPAPRLLRACFDYQPERDPLLPSPELGLRFRHGDVLEVVDQLDPAYWQARPVSRPREAARLIPSQTLEERRKAFCPASRIVPGPTEKLKQLYTKLHTQKPAIFRARSAAEFDRTELVLYEDVARLPPSPLQLLVLTGPAGVSRDLLRRRLCQQYPLKFAGPRLTTSDPDRIGLEGTDYAFMPRQDMLKAVTAGEFVEFQKLGAGTGVGGESGELIGLSLESIRDLASRGDTSGQAERPTAVIDCHPSAVRRLRRPEFRPLVVFLATPDVAAQRDLLAEAKSLGLVPGSCEAGTEQQLQEAIRQSVLLEKLYRPVFDAAILCDSLLSVQTDVLNLVATAEAEGRWVPADWVEPEMLEDC